MLTNSQANQGLGAQLNVIGGQMLAAIDGGTIDSVCPSDGAVIATVPRSAAGDVNVAINAAHAAFHKPEWRATSALQRGRLLARLGQLVERDKALLADLESRDTGKPLRQGIADVAAALRYFEFYSGAADKLHGDTIPFLDGYTAMTLREPHGVVASIIPWNYPLQIMSRVVGAGIAMGNSLVVKPAEDAPLSALHLARLAHEAGFPAGALNVVTGYGAEAGQALSAHPLVDYVTFTGSTTTGTAIQQAAALHNRGTTMELGGKSAQILFDDADLETALPVIVNAIIQNGGQTCSAGSRVLVQRGIYDTVSAALAKRFASLVAGPHWADLDLGPMINPRQAARVLSFIDAALASGVTLLARGRIADDVPEGGHYVAPALFADVEPQHALFQTEVFGPVLALTPFADEAEAVALANATQYGLVAGIWTRDGARQHRMAKRVRAGQVYVNAYGAGGGVELPFGGFGRSGHGREKGMEALLHMSATKTVVFRHD
jgi:aldehyde dehydrogenase (NAD+)